MIYTFSLSNSLIQQLSNSVTTIKEIKGKEKHIVKQLEGQCRFAAYCEGLFPQLPSKKGIKKAIKRGQILLNGEQVEEGRFVSEGDQIELCLEETDRKVYEKELIIVFEDEYLAVINKPAGIPVSGNHFKTIANALAFNLKPSGQRDATAPKPVHRLDALTSGLLLIGKTASSTIALSRLFEGKQIEKNYHAIVHGHAPKIGEIALPIEGKSSLSQYRCVEIGANKYVGKISLLALQPRTGRTHQLRIHMRELGCPIVGDKLYSGDRKIYSGKGLFLAATQIKFTHPATKELMEFRIDPPNKFRKILST